MMLVNEVNMEKSCMDGFDGEALLLTCNITLSSSLQMLLSLLAWLKTDNYLVI